jgi:hypothetical protein
VRRGLPVEINPSVGSGFKVMDWAEYFGRFKTSPEFPECLACGGANTKEHAFSQARGAGGGRGGGRRPSASARALLAARTSLRSAARGALPHAPLQAHWLPSIPCRPCPLLAPSFPSPLPRQTWCRGKRVWEAESVCLDCLQFSHRAYRDPDFQTPEEFEKERWQRLVAEQAQLAEA